MIDHFIHSKFLRPEDLIKKVLCWHNDDQSNKVYGRIKARDWEAILNKNDADQEKAGRKIRLGTTYCVNEWPHPILPDQIVFCVEGQIS